jgi:hypothetical protein
MDLRDYGAAYGVKRFESLLRSVRRTFVEFGIRGERQKTSWGHAALDFDRTACGI